MGGRRYGAGQRLIVRVSELWSTPGPFPASDARATRAAAGRAGADALHSFWAGPERRLPTEPAAIASRPLGARGAEGDVPCVEGRVSRAFAACFPRSTPGTVGRVRWYRDGHFRSHTGESMVHILRQYGYTFVFLVVIAESVGLPVPSVGSDFRYAGQFFGLEAGHTTFATREASIHRDTFVGQETQPMTRTPQ